jgi:conjugal transfer pilus assembly protein TraK
MRKNSTYALIALLLIPSMTCASEVKFPKTVHREGKGGHKLVSLRETGNEGKADFKVDNAPVVVIPEVSTVVFMNNRDVNRIVCHEEIKDLVFLRENGISAKVTGKDAFVNFKFVKEGDAMLHASKPSEMYVVCGENTYNLIIVPKPDVPPQTVRLSSGLEKKIKANAEMYDGLPFEKKVIKSIKDVYTDQIAESYSIEEVGKQIGNWQEITIVHKKNVNVEGEGLRVKEYEAILKQGQVPFKLSEKIFTKKQFADNPVAISIEKHVLRPGETVRIFVVEQRQEKLPNSLYSGKETLMLKNEPIQEDAEQEAEPVKESNEETKTAKKGGEEDE